MIFRAIWFDLDIRPPEEEIRLFSKEHNLPDKNADNEYWEKVWKKKCFEFSNDVEFVCDKIVRSEEEALNSWERDIPERIVINKEGIVDLLELDYLDDKEWIFEEVERQIAENDRLFNISGIEQYLKKNPDCLMWTDFRAKIYLQQKGYIESV